MQVGIATVDFTPLPGLPLMGNFRDDYLARGVHDPLMAKALVMADAQGTRIALLALDVCMLNRQNVALIRRVVGEQSSVPPEHVLVHATHTHSAPAPFAKSFGLDFEPYVTATNDFVRQAAGAVALAERDLSDAQLRIGRAEEPRLAFNRRLRRKDGSTQMNWEALTPGFDPSHVDGPWGAVDPQVSCLLVERAGRPAAVVVNYGLHPAILAGDNWLYSADYPGELSAALKRIQGPQFTSLFLNGCCGNVNHVDYRDLQQGRGFGMTQRVGHVLAAAVAEAMREARPVAVDRLAVTRELVSLDRMVISDQERAQCQQVVELSRAHRPRGQVDGLPEAHYAAVRLAMHAVQQEPDAVEVMAIRIGDVGLVGLPGEMFCELGMEIKRRSPVSATLVVGLCGDAIGYLPTRQSFAQGGYEVTPGSTLYQPGAGERLADAAVMQLHALFDVA